MYVRNKTQAVVGKYSTTVWCDAAPAKLEWIVQGYYVPIKTYAKNVKHNIFLLIKEHIFTFYQCYRKLINTFWTNRVKSSAVQWYECNWTTPLFDYFFFPFPAAHAFLLHILSSTGAGSGAEYSNTAGFKHPAMPDLHTGTQLRHLGYNLYSLIRKWADCFCTVLVNCICNVWKSKAI